MKRALYILIFFIAFLAIGCAEPRSDTSAKVAQLIKIGSFQSPVYLAQAPGQTGVYIVQQKGQIIYKSASGGKQTFLNIESRVSSGGEQGLLSIAFDPDWRENKLFYIYYTNKKGDQVVAEGKSAQNRGYLTRQVLVMKDFATNHNGGQLQFGPGGLYIGTGDGGGSGDPNRTALNLRSLLGKILRIDPAAKNGRPYTIPAGNPFRFGQARPEIFSYGLRNPWRFSIAAGRIWIGDVGQDKIEEIDAPTLTRARGGNFGWSAFEGFSAFNDDQTAKNSIFPVLTYKHDRGRCSVTGGYLAARPPFLGRYVYGDFCSGEIFSFKLVSGRARDVKKTGLKVPGLVSFARGNGGQIWAISNLGSVYRLDTR